MPGCAVEGKWCHRPTANEQPSLHRGNVNWFNVCHHETILLYGGKRHVTFVGSSNRYQVESRRVTAATVTNSVEIEVSPIQQLCCTPYLSLDLFLFWDGLVLLISVNDVSLGVFRRPFLRPLVSPRHGCRVLVALFSSPQEIKMVAASCKSHN